jgi:hypothetical protein
MKTSKLKKFETVKTSLIVADTDEERQCLIAELLLIAERMPGTITLKPTDIKSGTITFKPTDIKSSGETDTGIISGDNTGTITSQPTKIMSSQPTVFNSEELEILESLKNAEQ